MSYPLGAVRPRQQSRHEDRATRTRYPVVPLRSRPAERHTNGVDRLGSLVPQFFDQYSQPSFGHNLWLYAGAQTFQSTAQNAQGSPAERTVRLPQVTGKAEKAHRFGSKEVTEGMIASRFGAPQ